MVITLDHPLTEDDIVFLASLGVDRQNPIVEEGSSK